ncbi:MAG: calcium/proton exchanger [Bacteroidales bacterium]
MALGSLLLVPLSIVLVVAGAAPLVVFVVSAAAIIPLAEWTRRATEHLAASAGSVIGGLLNVTFGNLAEFIIALFVLSHGDTDVAKAMITGSVVGNALFGLGLASLAGGWGRVRQTFSVQRAGLLSSLMVLSFVALVLPAVFDYVERGIFRSPQVGVLDARLSLVVSLILIFVYASNLLYTLVTHRDIYAADDGYEPTGPSGVVRTHRTTPDLGTRPSSAVWSTTRSTLVLLATAAALAIEAELLSSRLQAASSGLHLSTFFLGLVVLPLLGNAAEYFAAVYFARQDRMDLVITIAVGSSIQVALLTAPLLVLASHLFSRPMSLVFTDPMELFAIGAVVFCVRSITQDGETTWFEGVLLLGVYGLLASAFFFATP